MRFLGKCKEFSERDVQMFGMWPQDYQCGPDLSDLSDDDREALEATFETCQLSESPCISQHLKSNFSHLFSIFFGT